MKLSELIEQKNLLREYDDLNATLDSFLNVKKLFERGESVSAWAGVCHISNQAIPHGIMLTPTTLDVVITALKAEIEKLKETEII